MTSTAQRPTRLLTVQQAATLTGCSTRTIRRRISDGTLPAYRIGPRHIRIRPEDLEKLARRIPSARSGRKS